MYSVKNKSKNNSGFQSAFTLIETLVYIAVFSLLVSAVFLFIFYFYKTKYLIDAKIKLIEEASKISSLIMRDLRMASYSDAGAYPIEDISAYKIVFYSDVDADNKIEKVSYYLDGSVLYRQIIKSNGIPAQYNINNAQEYILSRSVRNLDSNTSLFKYFNASGEEILDNSKILDLRFVRITLIIDSDPAKDPNPYIMSFHVTLRNLVNDYVWP